LQIGVEKSVLCACRTAFAIAFETALAVTFAIAFKDAESAPLAQPQACYKQRALVNGSAVLIQVTI
jgi:hypothetical protein